jgi:hypothetical protein
MSAVTLDNIGQLPGAAKPAEGVNYRALTGELMRIRGELPRVWPTLSEEQRGSLYTSALRSATVKPSHWQVMKAAPEAVRIVLNLRRTGRLEDLFEYRQTLELVWNDILSASENDHPAFKRDFENAIEAIHNTAPAPVLRTRADIDDWLNSLI